MGIGGGNVSGNLIRKNERMVNYYLEPFDVGMHVSDEPGYYAEGQWGIRIESDIITVNGLTLPNAPHT